MPSPPDAEPPKAIACLATLREMVDDELTRILIWDNADSLKVEARTAFDILAVHALLDEPSRKELAARVQAGRLDFTVLAGFCGSVLRPVDL